MNPIDQPAMIIRWLAVVFTLGSWAGIVLVVIKSLG
jgi:hypothetical protein